MSPEQQFLEWLKTYDPFIYSVVVKKVKSTGLSGWGTVLSNVGKAIVTIAPAYIGYKQSKDAQKLAKAQLEYEKSLVQQQVTPPPPVPTIPAVPAPNNAAIEEILRRLQMAASGQDQPPTVTYTPFVEPGKLPVYNEAVNATAKDDNSLVLGIGASIFAALLLL